jgi:tetratricopeptide (TPR) repeat protein
VRMRLHGALVLLAAALAGAAAIPTAHADSGPPAPSASLAWAEPGPEHARTTPSDLAKLAEGLRSPSAPARRAAARAVGELGPEATAALTQRLAELRKQPAQGVATVLQNAALESAGRWSDDDFDLVEALVDPPRRSGTPEHLQALETAVLLRGLAHAATTPAFRAMLIASDDHAGMFRVEIGRLLRRAGEPAVPALLLARGSSSASIRKLATTTLEAMGKRTAGDAVQTKNNVVLAEVLRAFGSTRDVDAVGVLLAFVASERAAVRAAARDALLCFDREALWKIREAYTNLLGRSPPEDWPARKVSAELFAAYDRLRLEDVYALLEEGKKKQLAGDLDGAVADFDKVLARQPMLDRKAEMASAYAQWAEAHEDADAVAALAAYRKAQRLDPEGPRAAQIRSAIATLEGKELLSRGVVDTAPFERALRLDPGNARAQAELDRLRGESEDRAGRLRRWATFGVAALLAVFAVVLFGRRPRLRSAV